MYLNFKEWIEAQKISEDLKKEILERFRNEIILAVNKSGGYIERVYWEEGTTYTKGEQYYDEIFENLPLITKPF